MKKQIIPAILEKKKSEFFKNFKIASQLSNIIQIDIMDGAFVNNTTPKGINSGEWILELLVENGITDIELELHLMVLNPWKFIEEWKEFDIVNVLFGMLNCLLTIKD